MEKFFGVFSKLNQMTHPTLLQDSELTELQNAVITKEGEAGVIVSRYGTIENVTIDTSSNAVNKDFLGAYEFEKSGVIVDVVITANKIYVYKRNPATLTVLSVSPDLTEVDNCLRISDDDVLVLCNREPIVIAGIFGTPVLRSFSIEAPNITAIEIEASGTSNEYSVAYVLTYYTEDGTESIPSQKFGLWRVTDAANRTLYNLPVPSDPRIIGKRLYRTQIQTVGGVDVGGTFYHCTDIPNEVTTWTDSIPDSALNYGKILDYLAVIASARVGTIHRNRLFLGNVTISDFNPYKLMFFKKTPYQSDIVGKPNMLLSGANTVEVPEETTLVDLNFYAIQRVDTGGFPNNSFIHYRIYLKTADGKYSDYYYQISIFDVSLENDPSGNQFKVWLKPQLWTAFLGAGKTQYPDFRFIEIYRCNAFEDPTAGVMIAAFELTPDKATTTQEIRDGNTGGTLVALPTTTVESPVSYPSAVFFSEAGELGKILVGNRFMIPEEGGQITKIVSETDGVVVAKDTGRHKIFTEAPPAGWRIYKISEIGIAHPHYASENAGRYYFYDGKNIRTNDDSIISLDVTSGLKTILGSAKFHRVIATDKFVIASVIAESQYGVLTLRLLIYDIAYQTWTRWNFGSYYYATVLKTLSPTDEYDFIPVFSNIVGTKIFIPQYDESYYDIYDKIGTTVYTVPFAVSIQTKTLKEAEYTFRNYKIITEAELYSGGSYSVILSGSLVATITSSGVVKTLISDTASYKKSQEVNLRLAGTGIKKIKGIKLIYNLIRGKYGE